MTLLSPLQHRLVHFARVMTRSREDAEDLVHDTVLAAFERFESVREPEAFLAYLFTVASRIYHRRRWRRRLFGEYDAEWAEAIHDRAASPETMADVAVVYRALGELPEKQREALALHEISGLTIEEIRQIQGGSLSGVKMRLVRGRQRLAELLGAVDPAPDESRRHASSQSDTSDSHFFESISHDYQTQNSR